MNNNRIRILLQAIGWLASVACLVYVLSYLVKRSNSVMNNKENPDYIGMQSPEIHDGKMTPEVLLALGRISDPQLSPDGQYILYGRGGSQREQLA